MFITAHSEHGELYHIKDLSSVAFRIAETKVVTDDQGESEEVDAFTNVGVSLNG